MRVYADYKESGVSQIGAIPSHWMTAGLKYIFRVVGGSTPRSGEANYWDGEIVWVTPADLSKLNGRGVSGSQRMITNAGLNACGSSLVPEGSLILSTRAPIGSLAIAEREMCTNQGCKALVPAILVEPTFFYFVLSVSTEALNVRGRGTTFLELSGDALGSFPTPVPPLAEQQAIAAFLDRETAKIDALVEQQRRLVALLKEKRQAVISHAVTKGLDPSAPMKPSGIDWLGDIPAHWGFRRLTTVASFSQGKAHEPFFNDEGRYICVTARFVSSGGTQAKLCSERLSPSRKNDIAMVMSDLPNGRALARAFLIDDDETYAINQRIACITVDIGDPRYFAYQLDRHMELLRHDDGMNQTHLPNRAFTKLKLVVPNPSEQSAIADHLDTSIRTYDALTAEAERAIALLQERRSALISAAVTGKIDVRETASDKTEAA